MTQILATVAGASGGSAQDSYGGYGGTITGIVTVTPAEVLYIVCGPTKTLSVNAYQEGYAGGTPDATTYGTVYGGSGGAYSAVYRQSANLDTQALPQPRNENYVKQTSCIIAGGGGGGYFGTTGGNTYGYGGGWDIYASIQSVAGNGYPPGLTGGRGATSSHAGAGGIGSITTPDDYDGIQGRLIYGGYYTSVVVPAGCGGGGLYGGGSGSRSNGNGTGGGGGSSYVNPNTVLVSTDHNNGNGYVTIRW